MPRKTLVRKTKKNLKKVPKHAEGIVWMNIHSKEVEKHAGKYIAFDPEVGLVAVADSLDGVLKLFKKEYPRRRPHVFLVPRKDEGPYILITIS